VIAYLHRAFDGQISDMEMITKTDLELPNHLSGLQNSFMKLSFRNNSDLMQVRRKLQPIIERNKRKQEQIDTYAYST
jgi:DNA polymerase epsilon subunit 1